MTVMLASRFPWLFRAISLVVLAALLGGMAETLIADVHDGDAPTSVSTTLAASDAQAPAAPEAPRHTPDSPHTCHCVHAHVITLPAAETVADLPPIRAPQFLSMERALASVAPEPHFRPPVA